MMKRYIRPCRWTSMSKFKPSRGSSWELGVMFLSLVRATDQRSKERENAVKKIPSQFRCFRYNDLLISKKKPFIPCAKTSQSIFWLNSCGSHCVFPLFPRWERSTLTLTYAGEGRYRIVMCFYVMIDTSDQKEGYLGQVYQPWSLTNDHLFILTLETSWVIDLLVYNYIISNQLHASGQSSNVTVNVIILGKYSNTRVYHIVSWNSVLMFMFYSGSACKTTPGVVWL